MLRRVEDMRREVAEAAQGRSALQEHLIEARDRLTAERAASSANTEKLESTQREVEIMRVELTAASQNIESAEWEKNKVFPVHSASFVLMEVYMCSRGTV